MEAPELIYQGLTDLMDRFDDPKGIESVRERVIRAIHRENWLLRYVATPGQKVANWAYNIAVIAGNARANRITSKTTTNSGNTNYLGVQHNEVHHTTNVTINALEEKKEDEKEKKAEDSRAGFVAILCITTLTIGSAYAFFYSNSRLGEIQSVKRDVDKLDKELKALNEEEKKSLYFDEVKTCATSLSRELEASEKALSDQETYYKVMTFATGLIALGVGTLAYDKLYKRSLFAHRVMVTTWLANGVTFAYGLTLPDFSQKALSLLEDNYLERKVKINNGKTRYDVVAGITSETSFSSYKSTPHPNASGFNPHSCSYPELHKGYTPYNPFLDSIWVPSAPPA